MELLFEFIFQIVLELIFQLLGEAIAALGVHRFGGRFQRPAHPILVALGFGIWGGIFGGLSLWVVPHAMIVWPPGRVANLVATPLLVGAMMAAYYHWQARRTLGPRNPSRRFVNAYLLALGIAGVRYIWAH